jgi:asparagine synthetase B (glutamine-hydrolysing)
MRKLFNTFFHKVFFYTLVQRLDRSFSKYQIEARVPFLDQELVSLSKKFSPVYKVRIID